MRDKESFIDACRAALKEHDPQAAIRELVARAVSEPGPVMRALGEPKRAGINALYRSEELTILDVCWVPALHSGRTIITCGL